ncbi:unnamed protein product [Phytophthora lilii]|uniref:Unnamed protein product n=1 Tax=Phytophthora lilii TaxID=2077276 RepID=A0A9W6XES5_9STRA|nr:unnamed protein product [Phytophthora lilii]
MKNANLQNEFRRLNKQVKLLVTSVKVAAACSSTVEPTKSPPMTNTMRELLVEVEDLRMQNIALQKEISLHHIYQKVVQEGPPGHEDDEPILPTNDQSGWCGSAALGGASTVVLQEFDENSSVLVRNVNGTVNLRYVCFAHRSRWTEEMGKRVISYAMVISDSEANKPSRSTESNESEVHWRTEGGVHLMLTEVDDNNIDVVYNHWGECDSGLHAQYLFVQWAHYASRLGQMVEPSNLQ